MRQPDSLPSTLQQIYGGRAFEDRLWKTEGRKNLLAVFTLGAAVAE